MEQTIISGHEGEEREKVEAYLRHFEAAPVVEKRRMLAEMKARSKESPEDALLKKKERKAMKKAYEKQLVKALAGFPDRRRVDHHRAGDRADRGAAVQDRARSRRLTCRPAAGWSTIDPARASPLIAR